MTAQSEMSRFIDAYGRTGTSLMDHLLTHSDKNTSG